MNKLSLITIVSLLPLAGQAANYIGPDGGDWGVDANWNTGSVPIASEDALFAPADDRSINMDADYSIKTLTDGFGAGALTLVGPGTLTIDRNSTNTQLGFNNATGNAGGTLRVNGNLTINNSGAGTTTMRNSNSTGNVLLFDTGSTLTINSLLQTIEGVGGSIQMNGTLASSLANLVINSTNVSFGVGHDSTGFGKDIVLLGNSKLAVDGGSVMNTGRKFQVNGGNAELELNGANTINNANINVGGTNNFLLDVNANQANMGILAGIGGTFTIDLDPSVTQLAFADSSANDWGSGTISIAGFQEGVIQFGGLTQAQLDAIDGGIYNLDGSGFLTSVPEPSTYALIFGSLALALMLIRRQRRG